MAAMNAVYVFCFSSFFFPRINADPHTDFGWKGAKLTWPFGTNIWFHLRRSNDTAFWPVNPTKHTVPSLPLFTISNITEQFHENAYASYESENNIWRYCVYQSCTICTWSIINNSSLSSPGNGECGKRRTYEHSTNNLMHVYLVELMLSQTYL